MPSKIMPLKLVAPVTAEGLSVKEALMKRHTSRSFSSQPLSLKLLSEVMWAAYGINRRSTRGHVSPAAWGVYGLEVYAITEEGAYLYDPEEHKLNPVAGGDLRPLAGEQEFVKVAPLSIAIFVNRDLMAASEPALARMSDPEMMRIAALDAGAAAENVYLYATSAGLNVVERVYVAADVLRDALGLDSSRSFVVAMTLGYPD
ncbi:MAG: nitroreductase family protein [Pseudoflavonifractor sp.]|nr:nitroreductase family protein [Alloprevotella sp.]MCM1116015.1 nitroreductase family protein [Pseudoflavonifractor sp.]